ncbi:hypothetical protein GPJ56_007955 [Histomonas meleagridis]|uniref:uncharacterized protein n=1 Tax=Histomonas meleagridis TaxID=135588 RepID=UPI00355A3290|nr:hypothetical protein GPJ56_007955 [Histomonas meleagridis]KAH0803897.1 hypothetical protein GO595_002727 [Histomonas meleagridis]
MFSFEGEYSHPYIDQEINLPGMRDYVQSLIDEEMQKIPQEEPKIEEVEELQEVERIVPNELPLGVYYEDLLQQDELLDIMSIRRSEYWRTQIRQLQMLLYAVGEEINGVESDIDEITIKRQKFQESHITRLKRLNEHRNQLKANIAKLKALIEEEKKQM